MAEHGPGGANAPAAFGAAPLAGGHGHANLCAIPSSVHSSGNCSPLVHGRSRAESLARLSTIRRSTQWTLRCVPRAGSQLLAPLAQPAISARNRDVPRSRGVSLLTRTGPGASIAAVQEGAPIRVDGPATGDSHRMRK